MSGDSTDGPNRVKPDGSAWREAQKEMADRNDATRRKGMEARAAREREAAIQQRLRYHDKRIAD